MGLKHTNPEFTYTHPTMTMTMTKSDPDYQRFAADVTSRMQHLETNNLPDVNALLDSIHLIAMHLANGDYSRVKVGEISRSQVAVMVSNKHDTTGQIRILLTMSRVTSTASATDATIVGTQQTTPTTTPTSPSNTSTVTQTPTTKVWRSAPNVLQGKLRANPPVGDKRKRCVEPYEGRKCYKFLPCERHENANH